MTKNKAHKSIIGILFILTCLIVLPNLVHSAEVYDAHGKSLSDAGGEARNTGMWFYANKNITIKEVKLADASFGNCYLRNTSNIILEVGTTTSGNSTFVGTTTLVAGTMYAIDCNTTTLFRYSWGCKGGTNLTNINYSTGYLDTSTTCAGISNSYDWGLAIVGIRSDEVASDTTPPSVVINYPTNTTYLVNNLLLNVTSSDTSGVSFCKASKDNYITNYSMTNVSSIYTYNLTGLTIGNYQVKFWCQDALNNINSSQSVHFTISHYIENSQTYTASTWETAKENFTINITYDTNYTGATAILNYNNTNYTGVGLGTNPLVFYKTIDLPILYSISSQLYGSLSVPLKWFVTLTNTTGSYMYTSTSKSQTVNSIVLGWCNSSLNITYMNVSFKDELNGSQVNEKIASSTWYYWLGSGSSYKTNSISNSTEGTYHTYCVPLSSGGLTYLANATISYSNTVYPQRTLNWNGTLTNSSTNLILYSVSNALGVSVLFQTIEIMGQSIAGVNIKIYKDIGGTTTLILEGITDSSGNLAFWLDPDNSITIVASKLLYTTNTQTITPSTSPYNIIMTPTGSTANYTDYSKGISWSILPTDLNLNNGTWYTFQYTLVSSYYTLGGYGFNLKDNNSNILATNTSTNNGGTLTINLSTSQNQTLTLNYYYIVNGSYANFTKIYYVSYDYGYSISNFFTDLKTYTNQGLFGINSFSITLIVFFLIFSIIGIFSYMSGYYNTGIVLWELSILMVFFDVVLGLMPSPMGVNHLATIVTVILALAYTIKEGMY